MVDRMAFDLPILYLGDEPRISSLHSASGGSQFQREQKICFETEMSVPGLECGYKTKIWFATRSTVNLCVSVARISR
jgi:hypothetical protein